MSVDGVPVVTEAFPRTVRLVATARLRAAVLAPLVDGDDELHLLAEIEGATNTRLVAQDRGISGFQGRQLLDLQTTSLGSVRFPIYGLEEGRFYEVTIAARRGAEPAPTSVFFSFQIGSRFISSTSFDMLTLATTDNWVEATNCLDVRTGEGGLQTIINFAADAAGAGNLFVDAIRFREVASCD